MAKAKGYQGWPSWNQWNVALYVANDYGLYTLAKRCYRETGSIEAAAEQMLRKVPARTPDGAPFTITALKGAIAAVVSE